MRDVFAKSVALIADIKSLALPRDVRDEMKADFNRLGPIVAERSVPLPSGARLVGGRECLAVLEGLARLVAIVRDYDPARRTAAAALVETLQAEAAVQRTIIEAGPA